MRNEIAIILVIMLVVSSFAFFTFNLQKGISGFAILNEVNNSIKEINQTEVFNVTESMALEAINQSEIILEYMKQNNFSTVYLEDTLLEAKRVLEQIGYAKILRKEINASATDVAKAKETLKFVNWEKIDYSDVLIYTNEIETRKEKALFLHDSLIANQNSVERYKEEGIKVNDAEELLLKANIAFYEERYDDCEGLLTELRELMEVKKSQSTILAGLKRGTGDFIQKYWIFILIFLIFSALLGVFVYKKIKRVILKRKIVRLTTQKGVLLELMKKTQIERFKENKIPDLIYNIRMKKYQERFNEIKETLPVLESNFNKHLLT